MDKYSSNEIMITPTTGMYDENLEPTSGVTEITRNNWVKIVPVLAIILVVFLLVRKK